ncbi:MAG: exonuclease [Candidatus Omnitrophica bacterium]|nr:exonuclease [Candidatus Omnitrophota bacterium]
MDAYIDIETSYEMEITVIGIYLSNRRFKQFIGSQLTRDSILNSLKGVKRIFTYNGDRFDIPMIRRVFDVDLTTEFECFDLMRECHRKKLYGGLKGVERILGIRRKTEGIDGYQAMRLWHEYKEYGNNRALKVLLMYNKEDTVNLCRIKQLILKRYGKEGIAT